MSVKGIGDEPPKRKRKRRDSGRPWSHEIYGGYVKFVRRLDDTLSRLKYEDIIYGVAKEIRSRDKIKEFPDDIKDEINSMKEAEKAKERAAKQTTQEIQEYQEGGEYRFKTVAILADQQQRLKEFKKWTTEDLTKAAKMIAEDESWSGLPLWKVQRAARDLTHTLQLKTAGEKPESSPEETTTLLKRVMNAVGRGH